MTAVLVILAVTAAAGLLFGAGAAWGAFVVGCLCLTVRELRRTPEYDDDDYDDYD